MSELKPCPFCGDKQNLRIQLNYDNTWSIQCRSFHCLSDVGTGNWDSKDGAITAWNTRADGWQPIETAPKDGRCLILFLPAFNESVPGYWNDEKEQWQDWGDEYDIERNPSHWMPMPGRPEVKE